jgi:hypothetical protein
MFFANSAPILHWHQHCLQMDQNEIPHDPCHLGVPSGASKIVFEAVVHSAQIVHLSFVKIDTISGQTESSFHMSLVNIGVPSGASKMISEPVEHSSQMVHVLASRLALSPNEVNQASTLASSPRSTIGCVQNDFWAYVMFGANRAPIMHRHQHFHQMDQNEIPHNPRHFWVPSGPSKTISEAVVLSAQTVRLTCVKISTVSKWTESSIHWYLFAYEYDQVRAKRFRSLRNVWHKPCTYVAPTLTLSPIGPKRDSTWPTSSISSIRCVHNDFRASSTFDANRAPILGQDYNYLQTNRI